MNEYQIAQFLTRHMLDIVFAIVILSVCIGAFKFHRFKPFREVFAPFYAIAMCVYTVYDKWESQNWLYLIIVLALGILIGALQSVKSEVQTRDRGTYIRDNYPYVLGWVFLVAAGIAAYILRNHITVTSTEQMRRVVKTSYLSAQPWYMWALYGVAGLTYYLYVDRRVKKVGEETNHDQNRV